MSGQDLRVLAQAFEQCQGSFRSQGEAIAGLAGELTQACAPLSSTSVGGDQAGQLVQQAGNLSQALQQVGDGVGQNMAAAMQKILDKFAEVDRAQAANAHLVVRGAP